jgi:hypothetical protein
VTRLETIFARRLMAALLGAAFFIPGAVEARVRHWAASTPVNLNYYSASTYSNISTVPAQTFHDGIGVNYHLDHTNGQWANYPYLRQLARAIGFKTIRSSLTILPGANNQYYNEIQTLDDQDKADAIRSDEIIGQSVTTAQQIKNYMTVWGVSLFEGPNEVDTSDPKNYAADTKATMAAIIAARASWPGIAIVAPTVVNADPSTIAGTYDYGNMHDYTNPREPETPGWGGVYYGQVYGSIPYNIAKANVAAPGKPVISTEFGFSTNPGTLTEYTQAAYLVRQLLQHASLGVTKQFIYDLVDEGGSADGYWGLARPDGSFKPSAYAVQGLLNLTKDTVAKNCTLNATFNTTQTLDSQLFCFSSGEKMLALWRPVQLQDPNTYAAETFTSASVTVSFGETITNLREYQYDGNFILSSLDNPTSYTVTDRPLFISVDGPATSKTLPTL